MMKDILKIAKALSDPNRVRALSALQQGELCACQVIELLNLAPSTVSRHMAVLKMADLVETRKDGKWVYYSLSARIKRPGVEDAVKWFFSTLEKDRTIKNDRKTLKRILKMNLLELCMEKKRSERIDSAIER